MDEMVNSEQNKKIGELTQDVAVIKNTIDNFATEFRKDLTEIKEHTRGFSVIKEKVSNLEIWRNWQTRDFSKSYSWFCFYFDKNCITTLRRIKK